MGNRNILLVTLKLPDAKLPGSDSRAPGPAKMCQPGRMTTKRRSTTSFRSGCRTFQCGGGSMLRPDCASEPVAVVASAVAAIPAVKTRDRRALSRLLLHEWTPYRLLVLGGFGYRPVFRPRPVGRERLHHPEKSEQSPRPEAGPGRFR